MTIMNCLELARIRRELSARFAAEDQQGIQDHLQLLRSYGELDGKVIDPCIMQEVERWQVRVEILDAIVKLAA